MDERREEGRAGWSTTDGEEAGKGVEEEGCAEEMRGGGGAEPMPEEQLPELMEVASWWELELWKCDGFKDL